MDPICFSTHVWCKPVLDYCLHSCKTSKQHSHCIELIQRPESSRRHKLRLTEQSIRSNDDKTRFTCVHRLMTTGHSQNICRKLPDDVVKIMCFLNIKACQHILLHQIHKIMIFKKASYDPFKQVLDVVSPYLLTLINHCLETGTIPDLLKHATVRPLLKKQGMDPTVLAHFRSISNLSFI